MVGLGGLGEVISINYVHALPSFFGWVPQSNLGFFLGVLYLGYYLTIEPIAAITYVPFLYLQFVSAGWFTSNIANYKLYALAVQLFSWFMQIWSHYWFEKRAPAFLDSLHQAFVMAPLFVWMEVMFMFGYRSDLVKKLQKRIDLEIQIFHKKSKSK